MGGGRITYVFATTQLVDGNGGVVSVGHCPDDVLRTECGIAAEEHFGQSRLHRDLVDHGIPDLSKSMPMSRSIQGKAFS
jgi:hypothetical protein